MFHVNAQSWDEYLTNVYPEVKKSLENCPERINIFLPLDARNETKEQEFKQKLEKDAKETREKLSVSKRVKLSYYAQGLGGVKSVAIIPGGTIFLAPLINPLLVVVPIVYWGSFLCLAYRDGKREYYNVKRNLENLGNNIFINYIKQV